MIRLAKPSEIEEIITITRACATHMIDQNILQWNEHYPNYAAFEEDVRRAELYVLTINSNMDTSEEIIGCITISSEKDAVYDPVTWITAAGKHFYIHRLAIHPEYQRQGYAKQLMDFAENYAMEREVISIRLDTFSANTRNQRFYEARGYTKLEAIYFPKQSDLCFYCYELPL